MNETIKKLTEEIVKQIADRVAQPEIKAAITKTKETKGSGRFRVVISTDDLDRHGESVDQNGLDIERYMENPIVLWGHEHWSMPVGITESVSRDTVTREGKTIIRTIAEGYFVTADINPMGPQLAAAYNAKVVTKTSIGMIVKEMIGNVISKSELLEFSFVPIPANPYTVDLMKQHALDAAALKTAGIITDIKEGAEIEADPETETAPVETEQATASEEAAETTETPAEPETPPTEENKPQDQTTETPESQETPPAELAAENPEAASAETNPGAQPGEKQVDAAATKAGRVLSTANESKLRGVAENLIQAGQALKEVLDQVEETAEGKSQGEETAPEQTPSPTKQVETPHTGSADMALKELDDFFAVRSVLRAVDNAVGQALADTNKKIKERRSK
jgi:hypothetical protein